MKGAISIEPHTVVIKAPQGMVFEMMTAFGRGHMKGNSAESSTVLRRDDNKIIAEFKTKAGLFTYTTREQVVLDPPDRITFKHLKGPLAYAYEEFILREKGDDTELTHSGEFIWVRIPVIGSVIGRLFTKGLYERVVMRHMGKLKETIEARAARSHVYDKGQGEPTRTVE